MKKLLSLLSVILVSSSATSAVVSCGKTPNEVTKNSTSTDEDNLLDNDLNDKSKAENKNIENQKEWDDMQLRYDKEQLDFVMDKNNKPVKNHAEIQLKHNWGSGTIAITSISKVYLVKDEINYPYNKFFNYKTISNGGGLPALYTGSLELDESKLDDLPATNADVKLKFSIDYKNGLIGGFNHTFELNVHINKQKQAVVEKEQLNHYIGTNVIQLGELKTSVLSSDTNKLVDEVTNKINLMYPKIQGKWHYVIKPKLTDKNGIIEMNSDVLDVGGRAMFKYALGVPEKAIPKGVNNIGTLEGLDKYTVSKNKKYANYSHFQNTLSKWYKENLPDTYDRDFKFVSPDGDPTFKPSDTTKNLKINHIISALNGKFTVEFNIAFANLSDYILPNLGIIKGVDAASSEKDIENAIKKTFESNELYKDFKDMFQFVAKPINGEYGKTNEVQIIAKNLVDKDKQYFKAGSSINVKYSLGQRDINTIINNDVIKAGKFLDDNKTIGQNILDQLNKKYSELNGKLEIDTNSLNAIDPSNPDTWKVNVNVKNSDGPYTGSKQIKFDLDKINVSDFVTTNAFKISDKFLLADKNSVSENVLKVFNESNTKLNGLVEVDNKSLSNFDATNKSTWSFAIKANSKVSKYLNIDPTDKYTFDLAKLDIANDVFKTNNITLNESLKSLTTLGLNDATTEIKNIIFGENKKYVKSTNSQDLVHPELKGMIDVIAEPMNSDDAVNGVAKIVVNKNYEMKDYLTNEVNIGFSLTQVHISQIISSDDISLLFDGMKVKDINDQLVKQKISDYFKDKGITLLNENDYEVKSEVDDGKLYVAITVTNKLSAYYGETSGTSDLITVIDIDDAISNDELDGFELDFLSLVDTKKDDENKQAIINQIVENHKNSDTVISTDDIKVDSINFNDEDPKTTTVTISGKDENSIIVGKKDINLKVVASDLNQEGVLPKSELEQLSISLFDTDSDVQNKVNKVLVDNNKLISKYVETDTKTSEDKKNLDVSISASYDYKNWLINSFTFNPQVEKFELRDIFNLDNEDEGAFNYNGMLDGITINSTADEIKNQISNNLLPYVKQEYQLKLSMLNLSGEGSLWDNLDYQMGEWSFTSNSATNYFDIKATNSYANYITGNVRIYFETSLAGVDIDDVIPDGSDINIESVDYGDLFKNRGSLSVMDPLWSKFEQEMYAKIVEKAPFLKDKFTMEYQGSLSTNMGLTEGRQAFFFKIGNNYIKNDNGEKYRIYGRVKASDMTKINKGNAIFVSTGRLDAKPVTPEQIANAKQQALDDFRAGVFGSIPMQHTEELYASVEAGEIRYVDYNKVEIEIRQVENPTNGYKFFTNNNNVYVRIGYKNI